MIKQIVKLKLDFLKLFYTKGIWSVLFSGIFLVGLIYLLLPGPSSIKDFPPVPNSKQSMLEGDTVQNPDLVAYFSDYKREDIMSLYWRFFNNWSFGGIHIPLLKINHPPEEAYTYIRDQQESTALEEYYLPFRESLFVNVYDPVIYNKIRRKNIDFWTSHLEYEGTYYGSKTTLRYYHSSIPVRVGLYLMIFFSTYLLVKLFLFYRQSYK